ncbi:GyrI-like domain-containing protein [Puerhibacterium puerhi]|uniref:GyrI-like domain-containing protein n=1 Tax=Puerhibacterium puerhi TaxID=2692623 RepID=UPI00135C1795|nr:GyrI-like domain-containing protein [Puerhibacterium puerhi]
MTDETTAPAAGKVDFRRTLDAYRARRGELRLVDVPPLQYLMIDGHGDPNTSPAFAEAVAALYPLAYRIKFASKADLGRDYAVMPLEGLWWADDMDAFTVSRDKSRWRWTLMIMTPDWVDAGMVAAAAERVAAKAAPARLADVRLATLDEGRCVQTLHVGSFDDEAGVLAQIHHELVPAQGLRLTGRHHEIYLSDFRRVPPERRRTILRQPVTDVVADDVPVGVPDDAPVGVPDDAPDDVA